jgi:hypothetical protein
MASDPRVFAFSLERRVPSQEIPLSWLGQRYERLPDRARALEVAPGVRIALMGTGDILLPDGDCCRGARIAVWTDEAVPDPDCPECGFSVAGGRHYPSCSRRVEPADG